MPNDDITNKVVDSLKNSAVQIEGELLNNLKHTDTPQIAQYLEHVSPERLADKIVNYISNPSQYLNLDNEPPGIGIMIGSLLDKLAIIRSRSRIIEEKLSSDMILDSNTLMTFTKEEIEIALKDSSNPQIADMVSNGEQVFGQGLRGGNKFKKTLKKHKRY